MEIGIIRGSSGQDVVLMVRNGYDSVVEGCVNVCDVINNCFFYFFMGMCIWFCYVCLFVIYEQVCVDFYGCVCWFWCVGYGLEGYDDDVDYGGI